MQLVIRSPLSQGERLRFREPCRRGWFGAQAEGHTKGGEMARGVGQIDTTPVVYNPVALLNIKHVLCRFVLVNLRSLKEAYITSDGVFPKWSLPVNCQFMWRDPRTKMD